MVRLLPGVDRAKLVQVLSRVISKVVARRRAVVA
jgi:hypothetical protein